MKIDVLQFGCVCLILFYMYPITEGNSEEAEVKQKHLKAPAQTQYSFSNEKAINKRNK